MSRSEISFGGELTSNGRRSTRRSTFWACALILVAAAAACGGDDAEDAVVAAAPCARLRDHLVDLRVAGSRGNAKELAAYRDDLQRALGDDFVTVCEKSMDAPEIDCASTAVDLATASACSARRVHP